MTVLLIALVAFFMLPAALALRWAFRDSSGPLP